MRNTIVAILLILLLALALRLFRLSAIPPGLTHDEANHGREALEILDGVLRYYFPLNYGSEPLYSYAVAASMSLVGENLFALRLVNILFGLAAIAVTFLWAGRAFDKTTALVAAGLMAVSFWPLAASRQALRAGMLPFFMTLAVWFYWQIVFVSQREPADPNSSADRRAAQKRRHMAGLVLAFALTVVATFHVYLAARVAWLLFPLFLAYLALFHRADFRRSWRPAVAGLLLAGLLLVPMFVYLANNPFAQTRLSMLDGTLEQLASGDLGPIATNAAEAFLAFFWPGNGDQFLAYNIPGRPVLNVLSAAFFLVGLFASLRNWRRPAYAFLLLWFGTGIIPSLITGPTANTTRNLAALPAVYILAALGFVVSARYAARRLHLSRRKVVVFGAATWLLIVAVVTARDYFVTWGTAPEVRGAYQHTLVEALAYVAGREEQGQPVVFSTVYPGAAHDPSIALVLAGPDAERYRWFDARKALLMPEGEAALAVVPSSTPLHRAFEAYLKPLETVALRADDLDPHFTLYAVGAGMPEDALPREPLADFASAVQLLDARWLEETVRPGEPAELLTTWRVTNPELAGPVHPPTFATDVVFFTHLLDADGAIVSQDDALHAPSWNWHAGDKILQVHRLVLEENMSPGTYHPYIGVYDRQTGVRLELQAGGGASGETLVAAPALEVARTENSIHNQGTILE